MRIRWGAIVTIGVVVVIIAGAVIAAVNGDRPEGSQQSSTLGTVPDGGSVQSSDGGMDVADSVATPEATRDRQAKAAGARPRRGSAGSQPRSCARTW